MHINNIGNRQDNSLHLPRSVSHNSKSSFHWKLKIFWKTSETHQWFGLALTVLFALHIKCHVEFQICVIVSMQFSSKKQHFVYKYFVWIRIVYLEQHQPQQPSLQSRLFYIIIAVFTASKLIAYGHY